MKTLEAIADPDLGVEAPVKILRPFMTHSWTDLAFLHWPFEPGLIQALLPSSVEVDCFDGAAWVGLIPFRLGVRFPAWLPSMQGISRTLEVNVRTYVRGPDGRRGIWFLSLDAHSLPIALITRTWYRIPYIRADLDFERNGRTVGYRSHPRLPRRPGAEFRAAISLGAPAEDISPLDQFLTCRWRLYSPGARGRIMVSQIEHPPWPLFRARLINFESSLLKPFGLETPEEAPLTLFSSGVVVNWERRSVSKTVR